MRIVSVKCCRENQNPYIVPNNYFFSENSAVYEIMWKNIVEAGGPHGTII
jgi:nitroimidazol reductase NimA-like FMN-containing flavoprotein (pyridoxamine 5'-phosphate oxidase superfamily)